MTEDISVAPSGSTEQTNGKNYVDLDGNAKTVESTVNVLQLRKEITIWKENYNLYKIIF